jgi:hypothetical protein
MELYKKIIYIAREKTDGTYLNILIVYQVWGFEDILKVSESVYT